MSTRAKSDAGKALASGVSYPRLILVSIWAYALVSGFLAYGLTEVVAAVMHPSNSRLSLQLAVIPVTAVAAGLACERTLNTFYSLIFSRRQN